MPAKNTCDCKRDKDNQFIITKTYQEEYAWTSVNIGELSMNKFIKLLINTIYGDLVSLYFYVANTIIGNNITERARSMAWYMEKGLHGF